jgi:DNA polymerase-3 subunit alpha (Gram-positive type)
LEAKACDTLKIARALLPVEQSKKLSSLCEFFGIERHTEHRALEDAIETWKVFECLIQVAQNTQNVDVEKLFAPHPLAYRAKKQTPATEHQVQRLREYREKHHIVDEIEWANLTRSEASRIMDKYVLVYGR